MKREPSNMTANITIIHSNDPTQVVHCFAYQILAELRLAHKWGAAGISVHCQEPFISGCITEEHEARKLMALFHE